MPFNAQQYLDQHGGDPVAALAALATERDAATSGRDTEGQSAARARRERDEARARAAQLDEQLTAANARIPADGSVILTPEQAQQYQQFTERGGLSAWDADREHAQQGQTFRQEALITRVAAAHRWNPERLTELLAGRPLEEREVTPEGGQPQRVIGLANGEQFRPASDAFAAFAPALALDPTPAPPTWPRQDAPAPTGPATTAQLDAAKAASGTYSL